MSVAPNLAGFSKEEIRTALDEVRFPFETAIYSSENYFNAGAIIRTGHSFLCQKYWLVDFEQNKFYKKASMGTHKWENIEKVSLKDFLSLNKEKPIVVFERRAELTMVNIQDFDYPENPILFFGSEKHGVPESVIKQAHAVVTIPLYGIHNDLNISVAAGIAMNDFVSKFLQKGLNSQNL